jgi:hypothetical protein
MSDQSTIDTAVKRLALALDSLDAAVEHRRASGGGESAIAQQLHALSDDRARLAAVLDAETAHSRRLEAANRQIAQRLDAAIGTIKSVLDAQDH